MTELRKSIETDRDMEHLHNQREFHFFNNQVIKDWWSDDSAELTSWMGKPPAIPESLLKIAQDLTTPALVYDLDAITHTVIALQADLKLIPNLELCFAVKANRCQAILRHMAQLGLGADITTRQELDAAIAAGLAPIYATAPGFSAADLEYLATKGVVPDFSSCSQLRVWCENVKGGKKVGLRLRLPVHQDVDSTHVLSKWSRFGVDPCDPNLLQIINTYGLEVVHLHVHNGETFDEVNVHRLLDTLVSCLENFSHVETINFGGSWTYLFYMQRSKALRVWELVGKTLNRINEQRHRPIKVVIEPGMLLTMMAGYLVTEVKAADDHPSGNRIVVLNTSAWNLRSWAPRPAVAQIPLREEPLLLHDITGCTCYEADYFCLNEKMTRVEVGDHIILNASGAYVSSTARNLHGLPIPQEFILSDNRIFPVEQKKTHPLKK